MGGKRHDLARLGMPLEAGRARDVILRLGKASERVADG
jgi:hypothetical protein